MATYTVDIAGLNDTNANGRYTYEPVGPKGDASAADQYYYKPNRNYFVRYAASGTFAIIVGVGTVLVLTYELAKVSEVAYPPHKRTVTMQTKGPFGLVLQTPTVTFITTPVQTVGQGSCDWSPAGMVDNKLAAGACRTDYEGKQIPNQEGCYFWCADGYELRDREMLETGQLDPLGHLSCDNGKLVQRGSCVKPSASCALTAPADVDVDRSECNYNTGLADGRSCTFTCKPGFEVQGGPELYPTVGHSSCSNGNVSTVGRCVAQTSCDWSELENKKSTRGACHALYKGKRIPHDEQCFFVCEDGYQLRDGIGGSSGNSSGQLWCKSGTLTQLGTCMKPGEPTVSGTSKQGASCALTAPANVDVGTSLAACNYDTRLEHNWRCTFGCKPGFDLQGGIAKSGGMTGESSCANGILSTQGACVRQTSCALTKPANMHADSSCNLAQNRTLLNSDGCTFACAEGYTMIGATLKPPADPFGGPLQTGYVKCNSGTQATVGSCVATQTVQQCDLAGFAMPKNMLPASECNKLYAAKEKIPGGSMCTFTCDTGYNISATDDQFMGTISCANQKLTTKGTCLAFAPQTGLEPQGARTGTPVPKPQDTGPPVPVPLPTPTTLACASFAFTPPCPAVGAAIVSTLKVDLPGATHIVPMSVAEGGWLGFAQTGLIVFASGGHIKYAVAKAAFTDAKVTLSDTSLVYAFTAGTADAWVTVQSGVDPFVAKGFSLMWILILCGIGLLILMALGYAGYKSTQTE
jgi:hypothetical protein